MEKIKSLSQQSCPHCGKQVLIEFEISPANVINIFTEDHIILAKQKVLDAIKEMDMITEEEKKQAEEWVKKEDVVFGPDDVDRIIEDIKNKEE